MLLEKAVLRRLILPAVLREMFLTGPAFFEAGRSSRPAPPGPLTTGSEARRT